jgi:hypothetical protein
MKYRKRSVCVDAFYLGHHVEPKWFTDEIGKTIEMIEDPTEGAPCSYRIKTLEGEMVARPINHYIVKGIKGEIYPCRVDIFEETYYPVGKFVDGRE